MNNSSRIICWFSCGIPSAVASYLMLKKYGNRVRIVRVNTHSEHPDNERFMRDFQNYTKTKVHIIESRDYYNINDVFFRTKFLRGPKGARCTIEMKKKPRFNFEEPDDIHVFGYTHDKRDIKRAYNFDKNNPDLNLEFPLLVNKINREKCETIIQTFKIKKPVMYRLGFTNNNCIGCVKSESPAYWMKIKKYFPKEFKRRSEQERLFNYALCRIKKKPVFLDELSQFGFKVEKDYNDTESISCDFLCGEQ